ncbi:MAG: chromosome segregation protein SMC [Phycisphaerae bacterium]|nr:chromosome segregation protein SMC [Phycisphaerae bacterium]
MKLKKLILTGFKSFADRTAFEFDEGVSCVVGPNGCGKSNVVDAVKWVLGERSAKSLRGEEMADVIFNGSSSRRPSGMAEVTLVFDNADGLLACPGGDAEQPCEEISVGRRLYRSGQSEYLINKAPARLKDIREMFLDTGVGVDAYSVIEQGRVGAFLQSSQEERRGVFDEAAGISKYKVRRKEAERRLERVQQNLFRLDDILGEVEKRLRSIKHQAGRARSHQKYTSRLGELRSLYLLARYHMLCGQRRGVQRTLDADNDVLASIQSMIGRLESARSATQVELDDLQRARQALEGRIAAGSASISSAEQRAEMLAARVEELGQEIVATSSRCEELEAKVAACGEDIEARQAELDRIETEAARRAEQYDAACRDHTAGEMALAELRARLEDEKAGTIDLLRRTAQLHNEINASSIRRENLHGHKQRLAGRADQIAGELSRCETDRTQAAAKLDEARSVLSDAEKRLDEARRRGEGLSDSEQDLAGRLADRREQRSAVDSRINALSELLAKLEGISAGARRVLAACDDGALGAIRGVLGQFLDTDVAHAPVVEAALSGADQLLLVDRFADLAACRDQIEQVLDGSGSAEVLCLDRIEPVAMDFDAGTAAEVIARATDYVRAPADLAPVVWHLLGRTFVTESLGEACAAAARAPRGLRFVTRGGDVLEPDGRVRLGAANRSAGLISRRSELSDLERRRDVLDAEIDRLAAERASTRSELSHLDKLQQELRTAVYEASTERIETQGLLERLDNRIAELKNEQPVVDGDIRDVDEQIETADAAEQKARSRAAELEQRNAERQAEVDRLSAEIEQAEVAQNELAERRTELQVARASQEEKKASLREQVASLSRQREAMGGDLADSRQQIALNRQRRQEAEAGIQATREKIDELYAEIEQLRSEARDTAESHSGLESRLEEVDRQLRENRQRRDEVSEQVGNLRVELGEVDVRIENLIAHAADEMDMDLVALYGDYEHDPDRDWDAVKDEIDDLTEKIRRLGNVNLDAISEQEELDKRREFLHGQLDDVNASRGQLTDLIARLNRDCRQRFEETFNSVRENFQTLFRKLFGGGRADIMLADPDDVLECGIEIVARPPGKELRSLSLLSGGEKTMTALALLFSIFRTRPSPFCVLDEVDAALDETNTERFGRLVQEFIGDSQFIIITHAKRTIALAGVLYGVTMQEAGVSKRISVRFEDAAHKLAERSEASEASEAAAAGS